MGGGGMMEKKSTRLTSFTGGILDSIRFSFDLDHDGFVTHKVRLSCEKQCAEHPSPPSVPPLPPHRSALRCAALAPLPRLTADLSFFLFLCFFFAALSPVCAICFLCVCVPFVPFVFPLLNSASLRKSKKCVISLPPKPFNR